MLEWLTGYARSGGESGSGTIRSGEGNDAIALNEPPITPAPLFAVRAFKTALFGASGEGPEDVSIRERPIQKPGHRRQRPSSPTIKPAGILLTPGIGPSRRKTVSFGALVEDDDDEKVEKPARKSDDNPQAARRNAASTSAGPGDKPTSVEAVHTSLTKALIASKTQGTDQEPGEGRKVTAKVAQVTKTDTTSVSLQQESRKTVMDTCEACAGCDWKLEFEAYQTKAGHALRKLLKYKQMAKAYARQKDAEATRLEMKLREEKRKVEALEAKVSELASSLALVDAESHNRTRQELRRAREENALLRIENQKLKIEARDDEAFRQSVKQASSFHIPADEGEAGLDASTWSKAGAERSRLSTRSLTRDLGVSWQGGPAERSVTRPSPLSDLNLNINDERTILSAQKPEFGTAVKSTSYVQMSSAENSNSEDFLELPSFEESFHAPRRGRSGRAAESLLLAAIDTPDTPSQVDDAGTMKPNAGTPYRNDTPSRRITPTPILAHSVTRSKRTPVGDRTKTTLPPDRLAAAKARLARKRMESKSLGVY
ncbi:MAG: hypothetical protein M1823_000320 [Watsoniomyces obsoletus]|nr:MAG: hypothetical protein M1823_000320 [Watsoniomyces obsoletus]